MRSKVPCFTEEPDPESFFQLDLEGFTPSEKDCDGVAFLLQQLFPAGGQVNAKQLAEYIIAHNSYGTVVKQEEASEDEDDSDNDGTDGPDVVFAFTSIVNLSAQEGASYVIIKELREFLIHLLRLACPCSAKDGILSLLEVENDSVKLFLFLNERLESIPLSACAQAVTSLTAELKEASLAPTHLMILSRVSHQGSLEYAYPEVEHIRPFALYDLQLPMDQINASRDYDMFLLNVVEMNRFDDILDALKSHV